MRAGAMDLQSLARLLQAGQATGLAALRVALPAPDLPPDPQVDHRHTCEWQAPPCW